MKLSQANIKELNLQLETYLKNRFYSPDPKKGKHMQLDIQHYDEGIYWNLGKVKYSMGFKVNGDGNLLFFAELKFPKRPNIESKIKEGAFSGNVIANSRFLNRPAREYSKESYSVRCKVKRIPEKRRTLYSHIYGYLIRRPMEAVHSKN